MWRSNTKWLASPVPAHAKEFEVEVFVNGQTMGHGHGRSKKLAEQEAARNAVETRNDSPCI